MLRCSIYKVQSPLALASSFISLPHSISFVKYFFRFSRTFSWLSISLCDRHSREQLCQYIMSGSVCQELFSTFFKIFLSKPLFRTRSLERSISILYVFRFVNPFFQFFSIFYWKGRPISRAGLSAIYQTVLLCSFVYAVTWKEMPNTLSAATASLSVISCILKEAARGDLSSTIHWIRQRESKWSIMAWSW